MKITIRGGYGLSNFGDDALLVTIVQHLKNPDYKVSVICKNEDYLNQLIPSVEVVDNKLIDQQFSTGVLIYGGGTQFYHFKKNQRIFNRFLKIFNPKELFIYIKRNLFSSKYLENKFEIASRAESIVLLGVGLGPFDVVNSVIENKTKYLFSQSSLNIVRNENAFNLLLKWKAPNSFLTTDLCYSLKSRFLEDYKNESVEVKNVGVIVRDWVNDNGGSEYYKNLVIATKELIYKGYNVTYILFDDVSDKYWLKKLATNDSIIYNPKLYSIESFIESLSNFDLFITARFHGAIFSALLGKPFITIEVEQKLNFISNEYKKGALNWSLPFNSCDLVDNVLKINNSYMDYRNNVSKICENNISKSVESFTLLESFLINQSNEKK